MSGEPDLSPLRADDVSAIASLHARAFPGFFLSTLGDPFLAEFYRGFLDDSTTVTLVARDSAGVRGAVVGTLEPNGFFRRLLRRRWPGFAIASARAVLRQPTAGGRLLRAVRYRGDLPMDQSGALLSSVCVDPAAQGTGLGARLVDEWVSLAAHRGARRAFLTTDAVGNDEVNRFYEAHGWSVATTYRTKEGRVMNCYQRELDGL